MSDTPIIIPLTVSKQKDNFYRSYLTLINALLGQSISDLDLEVLEQIYFVCEGRLTTENRKTLAVALNMSAAHLTNYIKRLRDKGYLTIDNELSSKLYNDAFHSRPDSVQILITLKNKK